MLIISLAAFLFGLGGRASADEKYFLSVVPQYGPYYPPGTWIPLTVNCRNSGDADVDGYVWLPLVTPNGTVNVQMRVYSPAHSRVNTTGYAFFASPETDETGTVPERVPPVTTAEWRTQTADQLARCEILAKPIGSGGPGQSEADPNSPGTLVIGIEGGTEVDTRNSYDTFDFGKNSSAFLGVPSSPVFLSDVDAPRLRGGYDACRVVVLNNPVLDDFDVSQRRALMDFVIAGGVIVLPAPLSQGEPSSSWLAPYLPVETIGRHQARQIDATWSGSRKISFKLREDVDLCEAVPGRGEILLRDEHYVHAAFTRVGLGRIVFTSFPINSLNLIENPSSSDPQREQVVQMWRELIGTDAPAVLSWQESKLGEERSDVLRTIVGRPTVPLWQAAVVVGVYALVVLGLQLVIGGAGRPLAFAAVVGAAIVGSLALVVFTLLQRTDSELVGARFATIDLASDGGGVQREIITYLGKDEPDLGVRARRTDVTIRPIASSPHNPPTIHLNPFAIPKAGAFAAKLERAWQAEGVLRSDRKVEASGVFGPDGLSIHILNPFEEPLDTPLLLWGGERFSLQPFAVGATDTIARGADRNTEPGDYRNILFMSLQSSQLRGDILKRVQTPSTIGGMFMRPSQPPMIATWLGATTPELIEYTSTDVKPTVQTHALVRFPLEIKPTPVGTDVKLEPGFVQLDLDSPVSFWDATKGEWLPAREEVTLLCFRPPHQMGQFAPKRVTITASVSAPQHTITVRRGQVVNGEARVNPAGPDLATWKQSIGEQKISFDVEPGDADAHGRIWILLEPQQATLMGQGDLPPTWTFGALDVAMEGQVTGPPLPQTSRRVRSMMPNAADADNDDPEIDAEEDE